MTGLMKHLLGTALAFIAFTASTDRTEAGSLLLESFSGGRLTQNSTVLPRTNGWRFAVNTPILVESLGTFDVDLNGLTVDVQVGLWRNDGTLLASVLLPAGNSVPLDGSGFRFLPITPILLATGESYVLGSTLENGGEKMVFNVASFALAPEVTYDGARSSSFMTGFSFPSAPSSSTPGFNGVFGPNLTFSEVPEPASIALLGIGIASAAGYRWRRRNRIQA